MKIFKGYLTKDLCKVLKMSHRTFKIRLKEPALFTIKDIDNLVEFGIDRDDLIDEICENK